MQLLQDSDLIGRSDEHRNRMSEVRVSPIYYTSNGDETTVVLAAVNCACEKDYHYRKCGMAGSRCLLAAAAPVLFAHAGVAEI